MTRSSSLKKIMTVHPIQIEKGIGITYNSQVIYLKEAYICHQRVILALQRAAAHPRIHALLQTASQKIPSLQVHP